MLLLYAGEHLDVSAGDADLLLVYVESYALWMELIMHDQWSLLDQYKERLKANLDILSSADTPQSQYLRADLLLHDAVVEILRDRRWSGLRRLHRSYDALIDLETQWPEALDVQKSLGIIEWLVSQMTPGQQRWVRRLTSLDGNGDDAIGRLERAATMPDVMGMEASLVLSLIHSARDRVAAEQVLDGLPIQGGVVALLRAGIDLQHGRAEEAAVLLDRYPMDQSKWYFLRGKAALYLEQYDEVREHLDRSSDLRQGPHLEAQSALYRYWTEILKTGMPADLPALSGDYVIDADLAARAELQASPPHPEILHGRIAQDAGRYKESIEILSRIDTSAITTGHKEELAYRLARAHQKSGDTSRALLHLTAYVDDYDSSHEYYRSAALVSLAQLYILREEYDLARLCAQECLDSKPTRHAESLHRQARAVLEVLGQ